MCLPRTLFEGSLAGQQRKRKHLAAAASWNALYSRDTFLLLGHRRRPVDTAPRREASGLGLPASVPGFVVAMTFLLFFMGLSLAGIRSWPDTDKRRRQPHAQGWLHRFLLYRSTGHHRCDSLHSAAHGSGDWLRPLSECDCDVYGIHGPRARSGRAVPASDPCARLGEQAAAAWPLDGDVETAHRHPSF